MEFALVLSKSDSAAATALMGQRSRVEFDRRACSRHLHPNSLLRRPFVQIAAPTEGEKFIFTPSHLAVVAVKKLRPLNFSSQDSRTSEIASWRASDECRQVLSSQPKGVPLDFTLLANFARALNASCGAVRETLSAQTQ